MSEQLLRLKDYEDTWFAGVRIVARRERGRRWWLVYLPGSLSATVASTPNEVLSLLGVSQA